MASHGQSAQQLQRIPCHASGSSFLPPQDGESFELYVARMSNVIAPNGTFNTLETYCRLRQALAFFGLERFLENETAMGSHKIFTKALTPGQLPFDAGVGEWRVNSESDGLPFTFLEVLDSAEPDDQKCLDGLKDIKSRYVILSNRDGLGGTPRGEWGPEQTTNKAASMSKNHQYVALRGNKAELFNALTFGMASNRTEMLRIIRELKAVGEAWADMRKVPLAKLGLFVHCYPKNSVQSFHLHCVDMRAAHINPSNSEEMMRKNMPLTELQQFFERSDPRDINFSANSCGTDLFFILGAPTLSMLPKLRRHYNESCTRQTKFGVVICASLRKYMEIMSSSEVEIYDLPTNFRAHHGPRIVRMDDVVVCDNASYREAQTNTSESLAELFRFAATTSFPVYFATVDRNERPTCAMVHDEKVVFSQTNARDDATLPNADRKLTEALLDTLVDREALLTQMKDVTGGCRADGTPWHATFFADVLTVACCLLANDESAWDRFELSDVTVETNAVFGPKGFVRSKQRHVPYCNATFTPDADGCFRSFRSTSIDKMRSRLNDLLTMDNTAREARWGSCVVWHDALLNDVDDIPAIELVKRLSRQVDTYRNWC